VPDAVFYLRLRSAEELAARVLASGRGFDFWESGMDLGLADDYYDSFVAYQKRLLREFDRMTREYRFHVVDASKPVKRVATALKRAISRIVEEEPSTSAVDLKTTTREKPKPAAESATAAPGT